ncbi:MAG TPA: M43 family zinc metalloprotease [Chitinophagales bacterium]|nr:M43 family zinc metalloprotease [Chitinophagales bacterium]
MTNFLKPFLCIAALAVVGSTKALAQNEEPRCGSAELLQQQIAANPAVLELIKKQEADIAAWMAQNPGKPTRAVVTIPVVVHLVYNPNDNHVFSDHQVKDQIDILNEDYRRLNGDTYKTPADFQSVAADVEIQFCLAKRDPAGNCTNGILRETYTDVTEWEMGTFDQYKQTAWPRDQYLNVWVAFMPSSVLGWSTFPTVTDFTDGVVIADRAFSRIEPASGKYNRGRTLTHEVGHWLNLKHVSGDDSGCSGTDNCEDTPNQGDNNTGCPQHPSASCSNAGDMFMNYMDYAHDSCMNLFTICQGARMHATLSVARAPLLSSLGCVCPETPLHDIVVSDILYPYGKVMERFINPLVRVRNHGSNPITAFKLYYGFYQQSELNVDWAGVLPPGADTLLSLPLLRDSVGYNFFMARAANLNGGVTEVDTVNNFMSRSFYVDSSAIDLENTMTVYPNPSSGSFTLQFEILFAEGFELEVFNVLGQRVPFTASNPLLNRVDVTLLHDVPGTYFVRAINDRKKLTQKLFVLL